jgi:hypothetical protein
MLAPPVLDLPVTESRPIVPPVVPVRFWDGDTVVRREPRTDLVWKRAADGKWYPTVSSGRRIGTPVEDSVMRNYLEREKSGPESPRFVPRYHWTTDALPGRPIESRADLEAVTLDAEGAVPFVMSSGALRGFWSLRDLCEEQGGEPAAAHVDPAMPLAQMREALAVMLEEFRADVSVHRAAGRLYARYQTYGPYVQGEKERIQVRTFVYVLTATPEA